MIEIERKILQFIYTKMFAFAVIFISLAAIGVRYSFRDAISNDAFYCLIPWYEAIKDAGGIYALGEQIGNYNLLYQFLIACFTYLPIEPIWAYKLLSCIFDFLLAIVIALLIYNENKSNKKLYALLGYTMVLFSPLVFLNSAYWGQCDVIYTFFCIAAFGAICKEKHILCIILYGLALTFKLQAIFLLPFFLFVYFAKKNYSIFYFILIPIVMIIASVPGLIMGRSVFDIFEIYLIQTDTYKTISMNYPSFWNIFQKYDADIYGLQFYLDFKKPAIVIVVIILMIYMIVWLEKKVNLSKRNMTYISFLIVYTCVLFLPAMHERYGFLYEILAILVLFYSNNTWPLFVGMYIISMINYGHYLFRLDTNMFILAIGNLIIYVGYVVYLMKNMIIECKENEYNASAKEKI